jgi:hypothetical protein
MTIVGQPCPTKMSKPLVGRCGGKRVILWGRVCARGLDAALVTFVLFLIVTCVVGASTDAPFFETWWGRHLFILLAGFLALAVLLTAVFPLRRWLRLPLDRLPDLDTVSGSAGSGNRSERRITRRGLVTLVAVVAVPVLAGSFYLEENVRGERAWNAYKRQQEARGERLDPAALVPPPVPDDQNFASTPYLAPLFDYLPGTQQTRDANAVVRGKALSLRYDAASSRLETRKMARSNSWVSPGIDLPAWYAAFLKGTNAAASMPDAVRARYGLLPRNTDATAVQTSTANSQLQTNVPTLAEAASGVLGALAESEPVLEELRAASRRPYSRFNLRYDTDNPAMILLPHYATLKRVLQVLQLRASAELALGRTNEAAEDIQFMFRLTDAIRDEPILIAHLVRLAELSIALQPLSEGLARHQWSEPQLRAFEERLRQFDLLADGRQALQGERALLGSGFIDYVRRSPNRWRLLDNIGSAGGDGQASQFSWQSALLAIVPSGWFYFEKLNYSRTFQDYLLPAIDVPGRRVSPDACRRADEHLTAMLNNPVPVVVLRHQVFIRFLLPALTGAVQRFAFAQSGADAAAMACALERYRLAHGQFPESLGVLVPEFISELPHDVINGQPLKYRRAADGQYEIYSVGWNETDEGGAIGLKQKGENIERTAGDWVWRLPPWPEPNLSAR